MPAPPPPVFSNVFSNKAVLEASPAQARVWGTAVVGDVVTLRLNLATVATATAEASGRWSALLAPVAGGLTMHTLAASGKDSSQRLGEFLSPSASADFLVRWMRQRLDLQTAKMSRALRVRQDFCPSV